MFDNHARAVSNIFKIPSHINSKGLFSLLELLGSAGNEEHMVFDISQLRRVTPAALVAIASRVNGWKRIGRSVEFVGVEECAIAGYLRRMDFFTACQHSEAREAVPSDSNPGKFVPVRLILHDTNSMGAEIASCLAPGGEDYEHPLSSLHSLAHYVFTEVANNVRQHSRGDGCIAAQVTRGDGLVRLALADNGRGILRSFQDAGLRGSDCMTHQAAILKALEAGVSSSFNPINKGVGLTLVKELAVLMRAWLLIVSGTGVFTLNPDGVPKSSALPSHGEFQGTLIGFTFVQDSVVDFDAMLQNAILRAGLLRNSRTGIKFE